jgi:hypothetical protein
VSTFLYTRPSESLLPSATLTVNTGAADAGYPPANLVDGHPELPAKFTGTSGSWVADLGSAKRVDLAAVLHHNFMQALNVRLQGNAANTWGAPTLDQAFTIPARLADNFTVNVWLDLKTLFPVDANRTFQFWRLAIVGVNTAAVSVGEWLMYSTRRDFGERNIRKGSDRKLKRPSKVKRTDVNVRHVYDLGTTFRTCRVDIQPDDAYLAEFDTLFRDALGAFRPFLIVPHSSELDAWFVSIGEEFSWKREHLGYYPATVEFIEESRGLYP